MSQYISVSGTILQAGWQNSSPSQAGCGILFTLQTPDQGIINIHLDGSTYVLNNELLKIGDQVTCFYSSLAPVPLISPPQYHAVIIVRTSSGTFASLDFFSRLSDSQLTNTDDTLRLNISPRTRRILPNGQPFGGGLSGKLLLVIYSASTRSIPAQTSPEQIVVFCGGQSHY